MARLMALSHTHDLLQDSNWRGVSLRDLVLTELMPYADPHIQSRWSLGSEAVVISPSQALALHMAVHELAANAGKFGALSTSAGHVDVNWTVEETGERCMLSLLWAEQGGPAVGTPQRQGFGLRLIQDGLAYELDADVQLDFTSDGIRCTIDFPLESTGKIKPLREMS
jgi:two-component sensor histidine kinase